jgi:hypothetical protein
MCIYTPSTSNAPFGASFSSNHVVIDAVNCRNCGAPPEGVCPYCGTSRTKKSTGVPDGYQPYNSFETRMRIYAQQAMTKAEFIKDYHLTFEQVFKPSKP